jgi:hypothetical protein
MDATRLDAVARLRTDALMLAGRLRIASARQEERFVTRRMRWQGAHRRAERVSPNVAATIREQVRAEVRSAAAQDDAESTELVDAVGALSERLRSAGMLDDDGHRAVQRDLERLRVAADRVGGFTRVAHRLEQIAGAN